MKQDINDARIKEITSWLQHRVSVEDACARLSADDQNVVPQTVLQLICEWAILICSGIAIVCLVKRIVYGPRLPSAEYFRLWIEDHDVPSDELWEYDTGNGSWDQLQGECGYAVVRDGKVIDFWMYQLN